MDRSIRPTIAAWAVLVIAACSSAATPPGGQLVPNAGARWPTRLAAGRLGWILPQYRAQASPGLLFVSTGYGNIESGGEVLLYPLQHAKKPIGAVTYYQDATYIAVDDRKNLYVLSRHAGVVGEFAPPYTGSPIQTYPLLRLDGQFNSFGPLAVGKNGHVYFAENTKQQSGFGQCETIIEYTKSAQLVRQYPICPYYQFGLYGMVLDNADNLYATFERPIQYGPSGVIQIPEGKSTYSVLPMQYNNGVYPYGIDFDSSGDLVLFGGLYYPESGMQVYPPGASEPSLTIQEPNAVAGGAFNHSQTQLYLDASVCTGSNCPPALAQVAWPSNVLIHEIPYSYGSVEYMAVTPLHPYPKPWQTPPAR